MNENPNPKQPVAEATGFYAPDPRPKWKQILGHIWPGRHHPLPELPYWAKDGIVANVTVGLSGLDRWRVLLSGRLSVRVVTFTQHAPGRCESTSIAEPLAPCFVTGERPTQTDAGKLPNPRNIAGIPVTEIRDGDILVFKVPGHFSQEAAEAYRAKICERLLPTKVDVLLMVKPGYVELEISHILRPALRIEGNGVPSPQPTAADLNATMSDIANAFLRWPLPKSVCADGCATDPNYPQPRHGTNLLTFPESMTMVDEVVRPAVETLLFGPAKAKVSAEQAAAVAPSVADSASMAHLPEAP